MKTPDYNSPGFPLDPRRAGRFVAEPEDVTIKEPNRD